MLSRTTTAGPLPLSTDSTRRYPRHLGYLFHNAAAGITLTSAKGPRHGDTVVVWKLDRLGRNTLHVLETVKALTDQGVTLVSTTDGIDSSTAAGRMMIGVLGSLAEYERELTKERTALKREAARKNGTKFGRHRKVDDSKDIATAKRMRADGHTAKDIAKYLGVSRATLYRYLAAEKAA